MRQPWTGAVEERRRRHDAVALEHQPILRMDAGDKTHEKHETKHTKPK
jgi:hypothetical protein